MNILTPLFEVAAELAMTEVPLHLSMYSAINEHGNPVTYISWYIGGKTKQHSSGGEIYKVGLQYYLAGDTCDFMNTDNIDENKLDEWVAELRTFLVEDES